MNSYSFFQQISKTNNACSATNEIEKPLGFYNEYLREKGHILIRYLD